MPTICYMHMCACFTHTHSKRVRTRQWESVVTPPSLQIAKVSCEIFKCDCGILLVEKIPEVIG